MDAEPVSEPELPLGDSEPPLSLLDSSILGGLVAQGFTDWEIAQKLRRDKHVIACERKRQNLDSNSDEPAFRVGAWVRMPSWVRYGNITKDEARAILAGAPQSGRYELPHYGRIGCSAGMLVEA